MIAEMRGWIARTLPAPMMRPLFNVVYGRTSVQRQLKMSFDRLRVRARHRGFVDMDAVVPVAGRLMPARSITRFSATESIAANHALVASALKDAGIAYQDETLPGHLPTLGIAPQQLQQAVAAVSRASDPRPFYLVAGKGDRPQPLTDAARLPRAPLTIFEALQAGGLVLADQRHGCVLSPSTEDHRTLPWLWTVTFPVDAVYTWVDGTDPAWAAQKAEAWRQSVAEGADGGSGYSEYSANDARFRSHDELRYSLRSLDYFAPWINHIYLVTAGQVPKWLDLSNPRITMIHHSEIFADPEMLPTFNSHAIEAQLHRIPGLSEHFLYFNDDVFFGRPVEPELFFHGNELAKMFLSNATVDFGPGSPDDLPVDSAARQNRALIESAFRRTIAHKFMHAAHPERVSTLARIEHEFADRVRGHERGEISHAPRHLGSLGAGALLRLCHRSDGARRPQLPLLRYFAALGPSQVAAPAPGPERRCVLSQ